jgi:hypothetical protein
MRAAATPSTVRALMDMNAAVDVRDVLGAVRVPALILHRDADALVPVGGAHYLAEHLPSATLRVLEGADHLPCGNPDQILDEIEAFLRQVHTTKSQSLALAAVVAVAGELITPVIDGLMTRGGRLRATPDGRRVVLFDGPATAVRSTLASMEGSRGRVCRSPRSTAIPWPRTVPVYTWRNTSRRPRMQASSGSLLPWGCSWPVVGSNFSRQPSAATPKVARCAAPYSDRSQQPSQIHAGRRVASTALWTRERASMRPAPRLGQCALNARVGDVDVDPLFQVVPPVGDLVGQLLGADPCRHSASAC